VHPAVAAMRRKVAETTRTVDDAIVGRRVAHIIGQNKAPGIDLGKVVSDPTYNPVNFFKQAGKLGVNPLKGVINADGPDPPERKERKKKTKSKKKGKKEKGKKKSKKKDKKKKHKKRKGSSSSSSSSSSRSSSGSSSNSSSEKKAKKAKTARSKPHALGSVAAPASSLLQQPPQTQGTVAAQSGGDANSGNVGPTEEELKREEEKRQRKAQRHHDNQLKQAQVEAERLTLQRKLFGITTSDRSDKARCPMPPEVGNAIMDLEEQRARNLCGVCRGGMQHSGQNM